MEKNMIKVRESNLELLRIVAMLLVLLVHYIPTRNEITPENFQLDTWGTILNIELKSLAFVCVNCFILVSGYFGIKFKFKSFANLLFQTAFWGIFCIAIALYCPFIDVPQFNALKAFIESLSWGWFVKGYIILFVMSPILNAFIASVNASTLGKYLIIFYLLSTIGGYFLGFPDFRKGMSALSLIGIYLTGAYLHKEGVISLFKRGRKFNLSMYFTWGGVLLIINILLLLLGIKTSPYGYLNPIIILMSVYLFLYFKGLNMGYIHWINFLSASAFSIYLFHCNVVLGAEISNMWVHINAHFGKVSSLLLACLSFIGIYLFCVMIDRVRIFLFNTICKVLESNKK